MLTRSNPFTRSKGRAESRKAWLGQRECLGRDCLMGTGGANRLGYVGDLGGTLSNRSQLWCTVTYRGYRQGLHTYVINMGYMQG